MGPEVGEATGAKPPTPGLHSKCEESPWELSVTGSHLDCFLEHGLWGSHSESGGLCCFGYLGQSRGHCSLLKQPSGRYQNEENGGWRAPSLSHRQLSKSLGTPRIPSCESHPSWPVIML